MKLFELGAPRKSAQNAELFESYFGKSVNLDAMSKPQARKMLHKVRELVREHRSTRAFHQSEKNPAYLQLIIMEQALTARISEAEQQMPGAQAKPGMQNPQLTAQQQQQAKVAQQATLNKIKDPKLQGAMKKSMAGQNLNPAEQQLVANAAMSGGGGQIAERKRKVRETSTIAVGQSTKPQSPTLANGEINQTTMAGNATRQDRKYQSATQQQANQMATRQQNQQSLQAQNQQFQQNTQQQVQARKGALPVTESHKFYNLYQLLKEDEVQQAQVVLAAQDMVDRVQKMLEDVTAMQFKDLPALVDQVKSQVGVDQANQFNESAAAALSGLVQNLQTAKSGLEGSVGIITGQPQPVVPGAPDEAGTELDAGLDADLGGEDLGDLGGDFGEPEEPEATGGGDLGRERR